MFFLCIFFFTKAMFKLPSCLCYNFEKCIWSRKQNQILYVTISYTDPVDIIMRSLTLLMVIDGCNDRSSSLYHAHSLFSSSAGERRRVLFEGQLYPVYSVVRRKPRSAIKINIVRAGRTEQSRAQFSQQNTC